MTVSHCVGLSHTLRNIQPSPPCELKANWTPNHWNTQQRPRNPKPPKLLGKCDIAFPTKNHSSTVSRCLEQNLNVTSLTSWWSEGSMKSFEKSTEKQKVLTRSIILCHSVWLNATTREVKVAQSCPTLRDHMDYTVRGILETRTLEWLAVPFSRGSSQPKDRTQVSRIAGRRFTLWATRETAAMKLKDAYSLEEKLWPT